ADAFTALFDTNITVDRGHLEQPANGALDRAIDRLLVAELVIRRLQQRFERSIQPSGARGIDRRCGVSDRRESIVGAWIDYHVRPPRHDAELTGRLEDTEVPRRVHAARGGIAP